MSPALTLSLDESAVRPAELDGRGEVAGPSEAGASDTAILDGRVLPASPTRP